MENNLHNNDTDLIVIGNSALVNSFAVQNIIEKEKSSGKTVLVVDDINQLKHFLKNGKNEDDLILVDNLNDKISATEKKLDNSKKELMKSIELASAEPMIDCNLKSGEKRGTPIDIRTTPKIGRNEKCRCGSGKKFKKCCLK